MSYQPAQLPSGLPPELVDLSLFLGDEFERIARAFAETQTVELRTSYRQPVRPRAGMMAYADGTKWDPGSGAGLYVFDGTDWNIVNNPASTDWSSITGTPTTLADYGITDAATSASLAALTAVVATKIDARVFKNFVLDYGADNTGTNDCDTEWASAVSDGGLIYFPPGVYKFTTNKTISNKNNIHLFGGSGEFDAGPTFRFTTTTGDCITFDNCQHATIEGIYFRPTVIRTSGFDITLTNSCFRCNVLHCRHDYGYDSIWVDNATECEIRRCVFRHRLGSVNIKLGGASGSTVYRCEIHSNRADNPYPSAAPHPSTIITRADSTAVTVGQHAVFGGYMWQVTTAGTTGTGAPSVPTSSAQGIFNDEVTDGTAGWKVVMKSDLIHLLVDSYAYSIMTAHNAFINGDHAVRITSSQGTPADTRPKWVWCLPIECDHNYSDAFNIDYGEGIWIDNSWIGSCTNGHGVVIDANVLGEVYIQSSRITYNAFNGILRQAGAEAVHINGNQIGGNSQASSGTYHGINVAASSSGTIVIGNTCGGLPSIGTETQGYGILGNATPTNIIVTNNICQGNVTGGITGLTHGGSIINQNNLT